MGLLIDGRWHDQWYESSKDGAFQRENAQRRNQLPAAEAGRYHLYVSLACPWAHRTLIFRTLKGLDKLIDVSVVSWLMQDHGWTFDQQQGSSGDHLDGLQYMHQRYTRDDPSYTGRVTVPVLWDKQEQRIVNNESAEIIRIFNTAFDGLTSNRLDLYPEPLRASIDALNERIYPAVNNGVYRAGFATTQEAYEAAFDDVFNELDYLEDVLSRNRYLAGEYLTEADVRLLLRKLARLGLVHQVVRDLFYPEATLQRMAALMLEQASETTIVQVSAFRDMLGIGRKRSVQILEYFDRIGLTRRVADQRHIRADSALAQQQARH